MSKWLEQAFNAKAVRNGGVIRRKKVDVHYYSSLEDLLEFVRENGFHLILNGHQYIVLCNTGDIKLLC